MDDYTGRLPYPPASGSTSSFPALKRVGTETRVRRADDTELVRDAAVGLPNGAPSDQFKVYGTYTDVQGLTLHSTAPSQLNFVDGGKVIVSLSMDGHVTLGPGYTPDEAAAAFWKAVERLAPARQS